MITPLIIANWKMAIDKHGVEAFKADWNSRPPMTGVDVVIAPPAPYLSMVSGLTGVSLCGQTVSGNDMGAHTGEIAAAMLKDSKGEKIYPGNLTARTVSHICLMIMDGDPRKTRGFS